MTPRRMLVLIKGIMRRRGPESLILQAVAEAREQHEVTRIDSKLHERKSYYDRLREQQAAEREAANG